MSGRRAFTLMELMMVVAVMAIIFVSAVSGGSDTSAEDGQAFTDRLQGDLSYARSLSISNPSDPAVIKVSPSENKYWVARKSAPDVAITHPVTKRAYVVSADSFNTSENVRIQASGFGGDQMIGFDSMGSLDQDTPATLRILVGDEKFDVEVSPVAAQAELRANVNSALVDDGNGKLNSAAANNNSNGNASDNASGKAK